MKKTILSIIVLCFVSGVYAQELFTNIPQKGNQRYEQVQSAKIAFFTTALELTPQEAEVFWPIYNNYWREREIAHKKIQGSLKVIGKLLNSEKPATESELKRMMEIYVNSFAIEGAIQRKYYDQFLKVLSVEKVAKLYKAEEDFRINMIHQLRGGGR
ncbi:MAG: hypothetical protein WCX48_11825 [Bacteroidales bacterium]